MNTRPLHALLLMVGLLVLPLAASADNHEQEAKPLTWISYVKAQPGKRMEASQYIAESGAKIYDGLMKDGDVIAWGVGMPINHRAGDDWDVSEWVTFRDWAAVDAFVNAFMAMEGAKSPEEKTAEAEEWSSLVEPGSHYDEIIRHQGVVSATGARPAYIDLSYFPVKPGQREDLQKLWEETARPILEKLRDDGTIVSAGLATTEVHDGSGTSAMFWTGMPSLAARDAMDAAFEAADRARGEEKQKEMMGRFAAAVEFTGHHDRIIAVVHSGGADEGDGEK